VLEEGAPKDSEDEGQTPRHDDFVESFIVVTINTPYCHDKKLCCAIRIQNCVYLVVDQYQNTGTFVDLVHLLQSILQRHVIFAGCHKNHPTLSM
jgi:hypothetical protein